MPRSKLNTRCQVPGCRNWATRGHTHCRPHRDPELGTGVAGDPPGNLNALRTGNHAHPLSPGDLDQLVQDIIDSPDQFLDLFDSAIRSIHDRCHDPVKTLAALQALFPSLFPRVADGIFVAELHAFLDHQPPDHRGQLELAVWRQALRLGPVEKIRMIRRIQRAAGLADSTADDGTPTAAQSPAPGPGAPDET